MISAFLKQRRGRERMPCSIHSDVREGSRSIHGRSRRPSNDPLHYGAGERGPALLEAVRAVVKRCDDIEHSLVHSEGAKLCAASIAGTLGTLLAAVEGRKEEENVTS